MGVVAGVMGTRMLPGSFFTLLCVSGQAVISTIVVYLSYRCVELAKELVELSGTAYAICSRTRLC